MRRSVVLGFSFGLSMLFACDDPGAAPARDAGPEASRADGGERRDAQGMSAETGPTPLRMDAATPGDDAPTSFTAYCTAYRTSCGEEDDCTAEREACFVAAVRDDAQTPLLRCLANRGCDQNDDGCYSQVSATYPGDAEHRDACRARHDACIGDDGASTFGDDWCWEQSLFRPELAASLRACLDLECAEIDDCLDRTFPAACQ